LNQGRLEVPNVDSETTVSSTFERLQVGDTAARLAACSSGASSASGTVVENGITVARIEIGDNQRARS